MNEFMKEAIRLSRRFEETGTGGPFGCVIVKDGKIVGRGHNMVTTLNDPTAHAEVQAIRDACRNLNSFQLEGCEVYTSCEPCPMCLGAIYWARPDKVYFANTKQDAADIKFDDHFIYEEIELAPGDRKIPMVHYPSEEALDAFRVWAALESRIDY